MRVLKKWIQKLTNTNRTTQRAWVEINIENLKHNYHQIKQSMIPTCNVMAVIRTASNNNGEYRIARELNKLGVKAFAVETVQEGVALRKNKVRGEILVMSETAETEFHLLDKYSLTQSVSELFYAKVVNDFDKQIAVHITIPTRELSMGSSLAKIEEIKQIYALPGLRVTGIYSSLSEEEEFELEDIIVTEMEMDVFFDIVNRLKENGIHVGKTHLQGSYAMLQCANVQCDYARIGSTLFGISNKNRQLQLEPVLSVRSRILIWKELQEGEIFNYGDRYVAPKEMIVAVVAIGSADGIPRSLSYNDGHILLHGQKVPIIGQICMNQLLVDVTELKKVESGDVVTVIGIQGERKILLEEIAHETGVIAEEVLQRFLTRFHQSTVCIK